MISGTDFIGIPSRNAERSREFYMDVLGLRPDDHGRFEFLAGDTCFAIWEPEKLGREFAPQKNAHPSTTARPLTTFAQLTLDGAPAALASRATRTPQPRPAARA